MKTNRSTGLTILELLTVMLIISIASAVAVPAVNAALERAAGNAALRELVTDLRYAQQMALSDGSNYYITFNKSMQTYTISVAGQFDQEIIKQVTLPDGIKLLGTNFANNKLYYTDLGSPSAGGRIELSDRKGKVIKITVLPATGRIRVYE